MPPVEVAQQLPVDVRQLAEHLAVRVGLVAGGRIELIFDENGRYQDGYKNQRLRPSALSTIEAFPSATDG